MSIIYEFISIVLEEGDNIIGIYKITNLLDGRSYIGQSRNIENRFKEHLYHNESPIDKDIHELGANNFSFDILEICNESDLDLKEEYYINFYNSINNGYNMIKGGQHNIGESNPKSKLTEQEVYYIRECYNNHEPINSIYELFKNKITKAYFYNLWEGHSWNNIHMDVYTEENKNYYKYEYQIGQDSTKSIFTNLEILQLRIRYQNETAEEIYPSVKDRCSLQTLKSILWGRHYSQIIVYDKKNKKWIHK